MESIYKDINKIKREGSEYNNTPSQEKNAADIFNIHSKERYSNTINTPMFLSDKWKEYGESKYDKGLSFIDDIVNVDSNTEDSLENLRSGNQSAATVWGNGLFNMSVIAGTTFADSFVGSGMGIINMALEPFKKVDENRQKLSMAERMADAFVRNPVSIYLNSVNKWAKDVAPTYKSDEYMMNSENGEWWKNMDTASFWSENILENAGFTLGMVASGKVSSSLLGKLSKLGDKTNIIQNGVDKAIKSGKITLEEGKTAAQYVDDILRSKQSLKGIDLTRELQQAVDGIKKSSLLNTNLSTAIAVSSEARQEGINSSLEYGEINKERLDSYEGEMELAQKTAAQLWVDNPEMFYDNPIENGDVLNNIKPEYLEAFTAQKDKNRQIILDELENTQAKIAGLDFALNFPILYASTLWQFGKTFNKGYDTQRSIWNNIRKPSKSIDNLVVEGADRLSIEGGKAVVKESSKLGNIAKIASNPLAEFTEEMLQSAAQKTSEIYEGSQMNENIEKELTKGDPNSTFSGYKFDPEAESEQVSLISSLWNGIKDTYTDPNSYLEGFSGLFMGSMGSVNFTFSKNNSKSSGNAFIDAMSNTFDGGIWQDIRDQKSETIELNAIAEAMNKRLEDPTFKKYYQSLVRHTALEKNKTDAINNNDKFTFLNNEHAQFISDVLMFEKVGKIQDLYDHIDNTLETLNNKENKKEIAQELRDLYTNTETGESIVNDKTDDQLIEEAIDNTNKYRKSIDEYRQISSNLKSLIGDKFDDEGMEEMIYLFSQSKNMSDRYDSTHEELIEGLKTLKKRGINKKLFEIELDGKKEKLTFEELLEISPSDLRSFIFGYKNEQGDITEGNKYILDLLNTRKNDQQKLNLYNKINEVYEEQIAKNTKALNRKNASQSKKTEREEAIKKAKKDMKSIAKMIEKITPNYEQIMNNFLDLALLEDARFNLVNTYNKYTNNPSYLINNISKDTEKAIAKQEDIQNSSVIESLKSANSIEEIRDIVHKESVEKGNSSIPRIINEMSISDNDNYSSLVSEYKKIENLRWEILDNNNIKDLDDVIKEGVSSLYDNIKNRYNSYAELLMPNISQEDLDSISSKHDLTQKNKEEIKEALLKALSDIRKSNKKVEEAKTIISKGNAVSSNDPNIPEVEIGNSNSTNKTNLGSLSNINKMNILEEKGVWFNGISDININHYLKTGEIIPNENELYKQTLDYLKSQGTFDFLNSGKLKNKDKIYFLASQEYWDYLKENGANKEWVDSDKPLLIVVKNEEGTLDINGTNYQVVGTFKSSNNKELHSKVSKNINKVDETIFSNVHAITPGRVSYDGVDRNISNFEGKTPWGEDIDLLFGIADGTGQIITNLDVPVHNTTTTSESNAGRLYILTKTATGAYMTSAVRKKSLSETDYKSDKKFFVELRKSIDLVAEAAKTNNDEKLSDALHQLKNLLYIGSKEGFSIRLRSSENAGEIFYNLVIANDKKMTLENISIGQGINVPIEGSSDGGFRTEYTYRETSDISSDILEALVKLDAPIQINKNSINGKWNVNTSYRYNDVLSEADILTSDLTNNYVQGTYFTYEKIDPELKVIPSSNTKKEFPVNNPNVNKQSPEGKIINIRGKDFTLTPDGVVKDSNGLILLRNHEDYQSVKAQNYLDNLSPEDLKKATYRMEDMVGDKTFWPEAEFFYDVGLSGFIFINQRLFPLNNDSTFRNAYLELKNNKSEKVTNKESETSNTSTVNGITKDNIRNIVEKASNEKNGLSVKSIILDKNLSGAEYWSVNIKSNSGTAHMVVNSIDTLGNLVRGGLGITNSQIDIIAEEFGLTRDDFRDFGPSITLKPGKVLNSKKEILDDELDDSEAIPFVENTEDISDDELSEDSVSFLSGFNESKIPSRPERKNSRRNRMGTQNEMLDKDNTIDIQSKIDENKDFQKDNCNGIAPK